MLSNIARIVRNVSLIFYYNITDISNTFVEYMREWIVDYRRTVRYIDEPRYDYEDSYDIKDYSSPSGGESNYVIKRNEWGLPIE